MIDRFLHIVTACSRPENLPVIEDSIFRDKPEDWEALWHIIFDTNKIDPKVFPPGFGTTTWKNWYGFCGKVSPGAGNMRNRVFDHLYEGWVHVIDDDNIMHPNVWKILPTIAEAFPRHIIVGDQVMKDSSTRLLGRPENMRRCAVDSASIIWHSDLSQGIPWDETSYECDGIFVEELKKRFPEKFVFTNLPISYYNYLR